MSAFPEQGDKDAVELGRVFAPKFDAEGLIPAIAQDVATGDVLMMAWMNADALARTIETGEAHYYSRSRAKLWRKGETSGHVQKVEDIRTDCDQDVVLLRVRQTGAACHRGYDTCFYRKIDGDAALEFLREAPLVDPDAVYRAPAEEKA